MIKKWILGKVFISHSSKDKPFVRKICRNLWEKGYQVWLDEKELVPGDALSLRLSDALQQSRVVIVVVTENSIQSKWLSFELSKATERMVEGNCRIIPILKGNIEVPSELKGLIYADFRKSFKQGMEAVFSALSKEGQKAVRDSWAETRSIIEDVFGGHGFSSVMGEYESFDYDFVNISGVRDPNLQENEEASIVYEIVHDHSNKQKPLGEEWYKEYVETWERYSETYHLIVSERPVSISFLKYENEQSLIGWTVKKRWGFQNPLIIVFSDLSGADDYSKKYEIVSMAKNEIVRISETLEIDNDV